MAKIIAVENMGEQHPKEIIKYNFDLTQNDAFVGTGAETIDETATWRVMESTALASDLSGSMVHATDYNATNKTVSVEIKLGVDGTTYYVAGLLEVASGRRYIVIGKLKFKNKSISVAF